MTDKFDSTGEKIKKYRLKRNLTQKQLAEKCGMYESQIRKYETGKANPKIQTLGKIASALELPVDMLRSDSELRLEKLTADIHNLYTQGSIKIIGELVSNENELLLLNDYRLLNEDGRAEAHKRMSELTEIRKYTK